MFKLTSSRSAVLNLPNHSVPASTRSSVALTLLPMANSVIGASSTFASMELQQTVVAQPSMFFDMLLSIAWINLLPKLLRSV